MTSLATPDAPLVWETASSALTGRPRLATPEAARPDLADLDLGSTRDLVRLLNEEDATVPAAAEAGDELAAAIDAAECGSTFGSPPGEVLAVVAEQYADEDDRAAAAGDARVGLVSLLAGVDATAARSRLEASDGSVRKAAGR